MKKILKLKLIINKIIYNLNINNNEYILDCAEKYNIKLPYCCRIGNCYACLGKIIKGYVNKNKENLIKNNYILTCITSIKSNCIIYTHQESNLYN